MLLVGGHSAPRDSPRETRTDPGPSGPDPDGPNPPRRQAA